MKTISVTVSDELYELAEAYARRQGKSVAEFLVGQLGHLQGDRAHSDELAAVERSVMEELQHSGFDARDRLPREQLYDRALR